MSENPTARIGILVEFNYEDLEVLKPTPNYGTCTTNWVQLQFNLAPPTPNINIATLTYSYGTLCSDSVRMEWRRSQSVPKPARSTNPKRATPARQTEILTAFHPRQGRQKIVPVIVQQQTVLWKPASFYTVIHTCMFIAWHLDTIWPCAIAR